MIVSKTAVIEVSETLLIGGGIQVLLDILEYCTYLCTLAQFLT